MQIDELSPKEYILLKGAKVHNLKNIDLAIPKNKLIVITGLSGSGKSSLAFDTLFAEGQRRYVESLSSYAQQFLDRMQKPEVDYIKGIAPAIAIEQKVNTTNPRSTVGTTTEIYDYLKLLFARVGKTYSPISGEIVKRHTITDVVNFCSSLPQDTKFMVLSPIQKVSAKSLKKTIELLLQKGFQRLEIENVVYKIDDLIQDPKQLKGTSFEIKIIIDRLTVKDEEEFTSRLADSVGTAFFEGDKTCLINIPGGETHYFSNRFELDGMEFEKPSLNFFSFNNPFGACPTCEGFGSVIGIDEDLVVPDKSKSLFEGAVMCWRGEKMGNWLEKIVGNSSKFDFPIHRSYNDLTEEEVDLLWTGNKYFQGINDFFKELEEQSYKIQYRVMLARYRGKTKCHDCKGTRLRKDASFVKVNDRSIQQLLLLPLHKLKAEVSTFTFNEADQKISGRILQEVHARIQFLLDVGLEYLTLNRLSSTLSGGESQRINLANALGSSLVGSIYILDEPSIGLHPRDTKRLVKVLQSLKKLGNTVIVVEHEEEVMKSSDFLVDIGPMAGSHGGNVVFSGTYEEILKDENSLTGQYLSGKKSIEIPARRRQLSDKIIITGARENNLQNVNASFPLHGITAVTGVSGSGKTTLVKKILFPALKREIDQNGGKPGKFTTIEGDLNSVKQIELVDQNPIGKSSRSNPVTYVKAYDEIRALFSDQQLSNIRGFKPSHFSFNVEGGRCETCQGEGMVKIEMQFLADLYLTCESCKGARFKAEVLEVQYKEKSIFDILELTIDDALEFFVDEKKILAKLKPLADVGLGYVKLGQSSNTLSGGEAQRIKLASFLSKGSNQHHTLFIFDEPTTGLHFHDINKLMAAFNALVEAGHSILVIEHNMEVIKSVDWVIDLGPEGGEKGGKVLFEGTPEDLAKCEDSFTGQHLKNVLK
ncbi:MAG: excinuclease ABC subunit A [Sphingobacteriales bacterium]|jgi:excinuclease ABC subunit A